MQKPAFVRDETGREVFGLRTQPSGRKDASGEPITRYYSKEPDGSRRYHGDSRDKAVAVFTFRQWEASRARPSAPDTKRDTEGNRTFLTPGATTA